MKTDFLETYSIGLKLRTLRSKKHLTLARLGIETGLSTAMLSKLETNRMVPTLPTLARICRTYGVGLGYFFSDAEQHSLAITRKAHISTSGKSHSTVKTSPLHVPHADGKMTATIMEWAPGATSTIGETGQKQELAAFVLEGRLELHFAGETELLEAGDCAVLNTSGVVMWTAREDSGCRALIVRSR